MIDMNEKRKNIKEYEEKKEEITKYLTQQIDLTSAILERAYNCFVDCRATVDIIPIEKKRKIGFNRKVKK